MDKVKLGGYILSFDQLIITLFKKSIVHLQKFPHMKSIVESNAAYHFVNMWVFFVSTAS